MQRIVLRTPIQAPFEEVADRFDENLFEALAPKFPKMWLDRHDPIAEGAEVHLRLGPMQQRWVSRLYHVKRSANEFSFEDEGKVLPFPLRSWHHLHRVVAREKGQTAEIIDDMRFSTGWLVMDWLAKPVLTLLFSQRKPKYVAYFEQSR